MYPPDRSGDIITYSTCIFFCKIRYCSVHITNCAGAATICLRPLQVDKFVLIRQVALVPACWLFKTSATSWPFDLESGVRVTCDVGYLCANFGCSRLRPDVRDRRQTDVRQHHRLMPPPYGGAGIIMRRTDVCLYGCVCQPSLTTIWSDLNVRLKLDEKWVPIQEAIDDSLG